jgi:hypothetical protein
MESRMPAVTRRGMCVGVVASRYWLVGLAVVALLLVASSAASATSSFYWYGKGNSTCWQTGQVGSPAEGCTPAVGSGYLPTPGGGREGGLERMVNVSVGGIGVDVTLSPTQNYCSYYKVGDLLTTQISSNEGSQTGFTTPTPYQNYQVGDTHGNVCQANGSEWGLETRNAVSGNTCSEVCGMHHYVSFRGQNTGVYRPWSSAFGSNPSLVVSAEADTQTFTGGTGAGGWGYVCPLLEDVTTKDMLEYCFEEWRGQKDQESWKDEEVAECKGWGEHNIDMLRTFFWPGMQFATERTGSANTYEWQSFGGHHFEAEITEADLINAINRDRSEKNKSGPDESNTGGCSVPGAFRGLSTNPKDYVLAGIEQGHEMWSNSTEVGETVSNLQLRTEYTPIPPEATTAAASGQTQTQITFNGKVNPRGSDTRYYFQYGPNMTYGFSTASADAGSGTASVPVSATLTGLQPGVKYHFRLVASSEGGAGEGSDEVGWTLPAYRPAAVVHGGSQDVFATSTDGAVEDLSHASLWGLSEFGNLGGVVAKGGSSVVVDHSGAEDVFFTATNGQVYEERLIGGVWSLASLGGSVTAAGSPSAVVLNEGAVEVFFRATNGSIYVFWASSGAGPWTLVNVGGEAAGDPTASVYTANNTVNVYFVGSNGQLWTMWATNGTAPFGLGQASTAPAGGTPATGTVSEVEQTTGGHSMWYRSTGGVIWEAWWNPANGLWTYSQVGGEAAGEPSGVLRSNGWEDIYYRGTDATIYQLEIQPGVGVTNTKLGTQTAAGDPVAVVEAGGYKDVYFPGTNNTTLGWLQGSGGWSLGLISPTVAPTTSRPAAVLHSNGSQDVLFTGTGGAVGDLDHGSLWSLSEVGVAGASAQGSESAVIDKSGTEDVFFRGASGQIYEARLIGGAWTVTGLGNTVAAAGSPSAVVLNEGAVEVFYRATNKDIYVLWASSGAGPWTLVSAGGEAAGDPTANVYTANNTVNVYFVGTNGQLWMMWATNGTAPFGLGQAPTAPAGGTQATGAVSEVEQTSGGHSVWYRSTGGVIWEAWWNPANGQWTYSQVGGEAAGEPSGVLRSNGWEDIYYRGTDSAIHQLEIQPGVGVTNTKLGTQTATGDPVAVLEASGYRDVYFSGANGISAWFQGSGGWSFANLGIGYGIV